MILFVLLGIYFINILNKLEYLVLYVIKIKVLKCIIWHISYKNLV